MVWKELDNSISMFYQEKKKCHSSVNHKIKDTSSYSWLMRLNMLKQQVLITQIKMIAQTLLLILCRKLLLGP